MTTQLCRTFRDCLREQTTLSATTRASYEQAAAAFLSWAPPGTDWRDPVRRAGLLREYLRSRWQDDPIAAVCRRLFRMVDGLPQDSGTGRAIPLEPWLEWFDVALGNAGYSQLARSRHVSAVRCFVRWARAERPTTDWLRHAERLAAWRVYRRSNTSASGSVRRWLNFLAGQPLDTRWVWHSTATAKALPRQEAAGRLVPWTVDRRLPAAV